MFMKQYIPWWGKIALKIILSRLPVNYQRWSSLNLFKHGYPENRYLYAEKFIKHFDLAYPEKKPKNFTCLELGPGDAVSTAIVAAALGATKIYLVDVEDHAIKDIEYYQLFAQDLKKHGIEPPDFSKIETFDQLLEKLNINYMLGGVNSLKIIETKSVDFIFSHSVFEHIRLVEVDETIKQMKRVLKKEGVMSHNIDLMDHLDYSLNNLRFSEKIWESDFMANSGFYTNRIRHSEILELFKKNSLDITYHDYGQWQQLPMSHSKLDKNIRKKNISENDLLIRTMHIVVSRE